MKCNKLAPLLFNVPLDWVIIPQQISMAPYKCAQGIRYADDNNSEIITSNIDGI